MSGATLPGTLPGLLRRGSPVVDHEGKRGVIVAVLPGCAYYAIESARGDYTMTTGAALWNLSLDLTDATGRAHAAWWATRRPGCAERDTRLTLAPFAGADMTDDDIARLRDFCLALGGAS